MYIWFSGLYKRILQSICWSVIQGDSKPLSASLLYESLLKIESKIRKNYSFSLSSKAGGYDFLEMVTVDQILPPFFFILDGRIKFGKTTSLIEFSI